jgi:hypothetical protein
MTVNRHTTATYPTGQKHTARRMRFNTQQAETKPGAQIETLHKNWPALATGLRENTRDMKRKTRNPLWGAGFALFTGGDGEIHTTDSLSAKKLIFPFIAQLLREFPRLTKHN